MLNLIVGSQDVSVITPPAVRGVYAPRSAGVCGDMHAVQDCLWAGRCQDPGNGRASAAQWP